MIAGPNLAANVVKNRSSIEFSTPTGTQRIGAVLVDISEGGARFHTEKHLEQSLPLSLRIDHPVSTDWLDAKVVWSNSKGEVGLQFVHDCPYDFLLAGKAGIDLTHLLGMNSTAQWIRVIGAHGRSWHIGITCPPGILRRSYSRKTITTKTWAAVLLSRGFLFRACFDSDGNGETPCPS